MAMSPTAGVSDDFTGDALHRTDFPTFGRYTMIDTPRQTPYGAVCFARDGLVAGDDVVITKAKKICTRQRRAEGLLRELRMLRHLRHENVAEVRAVFLHSTKGVEDLYIVSGLMETDLACFLKGPQALSEDHRVFFLYQTLRGLKFVHSADVVHGNLKPRKLLVNSNCDLKICDFQSAWFLSPDDSLSAKSMQEHDDMQWYSAPEVLCSCSGIGKPIDIWSVGCIFAEMLQRRPLFPGITKHDQLRLIIACSGQLEPDVLRRITNQQIRQFVESLPSAAASSLRKHVDVESADAVCLLESALDFNPDKRITVATCLQHPYLSTFYCPDDEPETEPLDAADFEFQRRTMDVAAIRNEIHLESQYYKGLL